MRIIVLLLGLAWIIAGRPPLEGQTDSIAAGTRIRVTIVSHDPGAGSRVVVGRLLAANDSSLTFQPVGSDPEVVSRSRLQRFEVRTGPDRGAGARFGALLGAVMGGVLGYATGEDCGSEEWLCFDHSETTFIGMISGVSLGALIGFMAGRGDRFREVPVPMQVGFVPLPDGGVRVAGRFAIPR